MHSEDVHVRNQAEFMVVLIAVSSIGDTIHNATRIATSYPLSM
jgi:hypothetical protein